jgi:quercetin dioxygenase-like cupin family protein
MATGLPAGRLKPMTGSTEQGGQTVTTETQQPQARNFDIPDEAFPVGKVARVEVIHLGEVTANRATMQPGFHWTEHVAPVVGTELCQIRHTGYVVSGRSAVRMADGTERELGAGDVFDIPAGHDMWVIGDEPYVSVDFSLTEGSSTPLT